MSENPFEKATQYSPTPEQVADTTASRFSWQALKHYVDSKRERRAIARLERARKIKASYAPSIEFIDQSDVDSWGIDDLELLEAFHYDNVKDNRGGRPVVMPPLSAAEMQNEADELED